MLVGVARAALVVAAVVACGPRGDADEPSAGDRRVAIGSVPTEPVTVLVRGTRVGAALRLDVEATGRGAYEGAAFEDPARWTISAEQAGRPLPRLVNGSVSIDRQPAGRRQWDTVVRFSVVYKITADGGEVRIRLTPPGEATIERVYGR